MKNLIFLFLLSTSYLFGQQPSAKMTAPTKPVPSDMFETPNDVIDDLKFDNNEIYEENPSGGRSVARIFGKKIKKRRISDAEYAFAKSIFSGEFPSQDRITITNLMSPADENAYYVRPTMGALIGKGYIRMNMGQYFEDCLPNKALFAHELTHVWQIKHYGVAKYFLEFLDNHVIFKESYKYVCSENKTLGDYNFEQQGSIVSSAYDKRSKGVYNSCEEGRVVSGIRNGASFPIVKPPLSPECIDLTQKINAKKKEIENLKDRMDLYENGRIIPPDYKTPGGNRKPITIPPPKDGAAKLAQAKKQLLVLQNELTTLQQRQAIVCK